MSTLTRRHLLGITAAAGLGSLAACTGATAPATQSTPTSVATGPIDGTGKKLRFFTYEAVQTVDMVKAVLADYDKKYGSTTTVDNLPGSGAAVYPDKLRTELLGGSGPDVWRIWGGQIGAPYAKAKQSLDLSAYAKKYGWGDKVNAQALKAMNFYGMQAGAPYLMRGLGGWYNKAVLTKAGVSAFSMIYDELEAMNDKVVATGVIPLATGGKYGWHVMRLFEYLLEVTAGPELHDKLLDGSESWDRKEVTDAFGLFKKWQDKKWLPNGVLGLDPADIEPSYVQGTSAYTITGAWTEVNAIQSAKADTANFGNFILPTPHSVKRHSGFVEGLMINARSANPDLAAQLIDFFISPESQKAMKVSSSTVKGAEPSATDYPLSVDWLKKSGANPFYVIQDQAFPKKEADGYFAIQSDVLQGTTAPADAAKKMQAIIAAWQK